MNSIQQESTILVVEDSDDDFFAFKRALRGCQHPFTLQRCRDGLEAQQYFETLASDGGTWPTLVFVDLNMPRVDGRTLLRWLRERPDTRHLRVVIYSTSDSPIDVDYCYSHAANAVQTKPVSFDQMRSSLLATIDYWLTEARTPLGATG